MDLTPEAIKVHSAWYLAPGTSSTGCGIRRMWDIQPKHPPVLHLHYACFEPPLL